MTNIKMFQLLGQIKQLSFGVSRNLHFLLAYFYLELTIH